MYADDAQFLDADYPSNLHALKSRIENSRYITKMVHTKPTKNQPD